MAPERLVLCGGVGPAGARPANALVLNAYGPHPNVHVRLEQLRRALWTDIPRVLRDLLDVAVYVYTADQAVPRGHGGALDGPEIGAGWRRAFRFRIPVREPERWTAGPVREALEAALSFLSEDEYAFEFTPQTTPTPLDGWIDFDETPFHGVVQDVVLFSGGLDSLAGAVHEARIRNRPVLLVNHRSTDKLTPSHEALVRELQAYAGAAAPLHLPVRVNKAERLGRETTQRVRSFLFAAVGAVLARMIGLPRVRFYENGVTSLNLPPAGQVIGARASRTTHPRTLAGFQTFLSALFGEKFQVENGFPWDTKTEVVRRIADAGCAPLIRQSRSCAHVWQAKTRTQPHCGVCSQCIDRRFAVLAAGCAAHDPAERYAVDLLTGARPPGLPTLMASAYLGLNERLERMGRDEFTTMFPELARALPHLGVPVAAGAAQVHDLYARHARQVAGVLEDAIRTHAPQFRRRELPPTCLLSLVCGDGAAPPAPPAPQPDGNRFERRGDCWVVRFEAGEENYYQADRGFAYLRVLLDNPTRAFTPAELEICVRGVHAPRAPAAVAQAVAAGELGSGAAAGDVAADAETIESCRVRLQEIERDLEEVRDSQEPWAVLSARDLTAERDALTEYLGASIGLRGRPRTIGTGGEEKVRKRVGAALSRARAHIAKYDTPLADHLQTPRLTLGRRIVYSPPDTVTWLPQA